jgi:cephalosporin-C deacetylase-like acetyl esterase
MTTFLNSFFKSYLRSMVILTCMLTTALPGADFSVETVSMDTGRMESFMLAEAEKIQQAAWERINTAEKLESEKEQLLKEFRFMIGLDPLPERADLQVTIVRTIELDDYTIEVIHYQSLPGFYVTADLYKPRKKTGRLPAVIWGPGHGGGEYGTKTSRQKHAALWARSGYICIVVDPIQAAEIYGIHHGLSGYDLRDWYSRGYTPMGIEVWNAMRTVDYLLTRPDVDGSKLTITGVSGGGHLSWMAGAADPRINVVQPAAGTADVPTHIRRNLQNMHCDCAYFVNTFRHDWFTLAALICPRPLLMHNSTGDAYYPPEGYLSILGKAKKIYGWYGVAEQAEMCEVPGPHGYKTPQREQGVDFSNLWLMGKKTAVKEQPIQEVSAEKLGALGGIYAKHPDNINDRIQDLLIPVAGLESYRTTAEWENKKAGIEKNLREVVFRNLPSQVRPVIKEKGEHDSFIMETELGVQVGMVSFVPSEEGPIKSAVLYVASPGDTGTNRMWSFMKMFPLPEAGTSKHMVFPRGIGSRIWNNPTHTKFERDAQTLGRTLDDMRLYDVLCAVEQVASHPSFKDCELTLVGKGPQAIIAAYAAILDSRVTRVVLHSPNKTHRAGPFFLNVLRYTDIPQALAMLAPRCELVFLTGEIEDFGYTRKIYELYGAADKFRKCSSVPQAIHIKD